MARMTRYLLVHAPDDQGRWEVLCALDDERRPWEDGVDAFVYSKWGSYGPGCRVAWVVDAGVCIPGPGCWVKIDYAGKVLEYGDPT